MHNRLLFPLAASLFTAPLLAQATHRLSTSAGAAEANAQSSLPELSDDGRHVLFYSDASNLVTNDTNGAGDVFIKDRLLGTVERVSVSSAGVEGNAVSGPVYAFVRGPLAMSADARHVVFRSEASNLVANDTNGVADIFVRDRQRKTTVRVSVTSAGLQSSAASIDCAISADGRFVAIVGSGLDPADGNTLTDIYLHDRDADRDGIMDEAGAIRTELVSVDSQGVQANDVCEKPALSRDGRYVAYRSVATNLVAGDTNGARDIFVYDALRRTTINVHRDPLGQLGDANATNTPKLSADGRFVLFVSFATNLVPGGDTNGGADVFVHDRDPDRNGLFDESNGNTVRVSVSTTGAQGTAPSSPQASDPSMSPCGRFVVFTSTYDNLVTGDTNDSFDIFLHDRDADADGIFDEPGAIRTTLESVTNAGTLPAKNSGSYAPVVSADGRRIAYHSFAADLVNGDTNQTRDIFLRTRTGLLLDASARDLQAGNNLSLTAWDVVPGSFAGIALTSFNSIPLPILPLSTGTLTPVLSTSLTVPTGVSGRFGLQAFAVTPGGMLVDSPVVEILVR